MMRPMTEAERLKAMPAAMRAIVLDVCQERGVDWARVLSRARYQELTRARFEIWGRMRERTLTATGLPPSYPSIARLFGVDHSTVIYGVQQREKALAAGVWK